MKTFTYIAALLIAIPTVGRTMEPPTVGEPTDVMTRVFVIDVDEIDTADQTFTANVYFDMKWTDTRLAHTEAGNITKPLSEVWNPVVLLVNRQRMFNSLPDTVTITPEGLVTYRQRVWGQFSQPLHLREFPFDKHTFSIILATAAYTDEEVAFTQAPDTLSGIATDLSLPDFTVTDSRIVTDPYKPVPWSPDVPALRFEFDAVRESGYYVAKVIVPLLLIVAMSWIVFWIDPKESGTQIGLGATAMLTLIAYRFAIDSSLPKVAYLTRLDSFILVATALVFASLIEVVITSFLAGNDRAALARLIDRIMRVAFPTVFTALAVRTFLA